MEASGRNRTPDKLALAERKRLFRICDQALVDVVHILAPRWVVGIGAFAEKRIQAVLNGVALKTGRITHPSPANPRANRGVGAGGGVRIGGHGDRPCRCEQ